MAVYIGKTTTLKGESGREYKFRLYTFERFHELTTDIPSGPAVYLFTKRAISTGTYYHTYLYVGEAENLPSHFVHHPKEIDIMAHEANCIGLYMDDYTQNQEERERMLRDILEARNFPCNFPYN